LKAITFTTLEVVETKKNNITMTFKNEFIVSGAIQFILPCSLIVISQRKRLVLARHKGSFEF
jgi:hypothetical protein